MKQVIGYYCSKCNTAHLLDNAVISPKHAEFYKAHKKYKVSMTGGKEMKRTIWCPKCGTKINYKEPEGACPIDEYPQCPKCDAYIYLVATEQDYIVRNIQIKMTNC